MIAMNNVALTRLAGGFGTTFTLEIYSGAMPTTYVQANAQSQLLAKTPSSVSFSSTSPGIFKNTAAIPAFNATATGTATWFAIYNGANNYIMGDLTDAGPNIAPLYINSVNLVSGSPVNVIQFGIKLTQ